MAAFRKRKDKWHVQIRKSGTAPLTKTFTHKKDAQQWASEIERKLDGSLELRYAHFKSKESGNKSIVFQ